MNCVPHVKIACPPGKSSSAEVSRSVPKAGSRSISPTTRVGQPAKRIARGLDAVAANVVERAAARLHLVANVGRIGIEVAESRDHRTQLPDPPLVQQFPQAQPLGDSCES